MVNSIGYSQIKCQWSIPLTTIILNIKLWSRLMPMTKVIKFIPLARFTTYISQCVGLEKRSDNSTHTPLSMDSNNSNKSINLILQ